MSNTITIPNELYRQADSVSAKEKKPLSDVVAEWVELGWRVKKSGLDLKWLLMEQEADEDIKAGRLSKPYSTPAELQQALDKLK